MSEVPTRLLLDQLEQWFATAEFPDFRGAHNGVQVEPPERCRRIATAVDACLSTVEAAVAAGADLLIVHHGLLWGGVRPIVGPLAATLRLLLGHGCGLYSVHLPLDAHPELGNNALLADRLGLSERRPFGSFQGTPIGWLGESPVRDVDAAAARLGFPVVEAVPPTRATGPIAIVSGSAGELIAEAAAAGARLLFTGEATHHHRVAARDLGIGLWLGGHYATETLGVRAVGERLAARFGLEHRFLDQPTGG